MFVCVRVSYFASALTVLTDDFNQIIYYRTRRTRLRLIETKIFLINYKATPAAQQQHTGSSSGISKTFCFRTISIGKANGVVGIGSRAPLGSVLCPLSALHNRLSLLWLCSQGCGRSGIRYHAVRCWRLCQRCCRRCPTFWAPLRYTHKQIRTQTYIHTHKQFMWYDAAFMYSTLRFVMLIRIVSFDCLSLRSLCRCHCGCRCVAAQLPAALSDPRIQTHTHVRLHMAVHTFRFRFAYVLHIRFA